MVFIAHVREALRPRREAEASCRSSPRRCRRSPPTRRRSRSSFGPGIKFNDGTPFNAAAVKQSLDRHKTLKRSARASELSPVTSVDAPGHTVVLHLRRRYSPITAQLADRAGMIMSPKALDELGDKFATNPVCVGPFMFKDRIAGDHITLVKSPYYYAKTKVHLDQIVFKIITDPARARRTSARTTSTSRTASRRPSCRRSERQVAARAQVGVDRLPGNHDQHREQERPREGRTRTSARRSRSRRSAAGVRARARPQRDQQGRLRRDATADCFPFPPASPYSAATKGIPCHLHGERRRGARRRSSSGVRRPSTCTSCSAPTRSPRGSAQVIQAMEKPIGFNVVLEPTEFIDLAQPRGRRQVRDVRGRLVGPRRPGRQHLPVRQHDGLAERQRLLEPELDYATNRRAQVR